MSFYIFPSVNFFLYFHIWLLHTWYFSEKKFLCDIFSQINFMYIFSRLLFQMYFFYTSDYFTWLLYSQTKFVQEFFYTCKIYTLFLHMFIYPWFLYTFFTTISFYRSIFIFMWFFFLHNCGLSSQPEQLKSKAPPVHV